MVVFPIISTLISLACALLIARDAARRPRPDKVAWAVAFAVFAVAAGAEVAGATLGWTPTLARVYYLTGAVLVVGYLALGELYLLAGPRIATLAPGIALLITAGCAALVWGAPVDEARLAGEGWEALERGPALIAAAAALNAGGTLVLVGGLLYSAWKFRRSGAQRNRMVGCVLIAVGTLVVAAGGTLTRFGEAASFYIAMSAGVATIFAGYLQIRRPTTGATGAALAGPTPAGSGNAPAANAPAVGAATGLALAPPPVPSPLSATNGHGASHAHDLGGSVPIQARGDHAVASAPDGTDRLPPPVATDPPTDPGAAFLEERFLPLDDAALAEAARAWSAPRPAIDALSRADARRVWALRQRLSPVGRAALDGHTAPALAQLADLYFGVLAPDAPPVEPTFPDRAVIDTNAPNVAPPPAPTDERVGSPR